MSYVSIALNEQSFNNKPLITICYSFFLSSSKSRYNDLLTTERLRTVRLRTTILTRRLRIFN